MSKKLRERLGEVLHLYAGEVVTGAVGYGIPCPFHVDSNPSCTVFYDTGVFYCLAGCGTKPLAVGLRKMGVPQSVVDEFKERKEEERPRLSPLREGEFSVVGRDQSQDRVGVVSEEPWGWDSWGYRGIRPASLTVKGSYIYETFRPSVVRLWIGSKGKIRQERYSRMCLHYGDHCVYARLSSEQEIKYYNSSGLSLKDQRLHPFGLQSFILPKKQAGIILVEGPYDVLMTVQNLEDLGIKDHFSVIGLLGVSHWDSFLTKLELRLLPHLGSTPLIFAFDNDKAGRDLTVRATHDCRSKLLMPTNQLLELPYPTQDPGKCDKKHLKKALVALGY